MDHCELKKSVIFTIVSVLNFDLMFDNFKHLRKPVNIRVLCLVFLFLFFSCKGRINIIKLANQCNSHQNPDTILYRSLNANSPLHM